jgi:hypothetical protein
MQEVDTSCRLADVRIEGEIRRARPARPDFSRSGSASRLVRLAKIQTSILQPARAARPTVLQPEFVADEGSFPIRKTHYKPQITLGRIHVLGMHWIELTSRLSLPQKPLLAYTSSTVLTRSD